MNKYKKVLLCMMFFLVTVLSVYLVWKQPFLLTTFLVFIQIYKNKFLPIQNEWRMFVIAGVIGTFSEIVLIYSGAWKYAVAQILNFPIWIIPLWGIVITTGIALHEELKKI